ncbi:hypothetical protein EDC01DRAFT_716007 [Geopyxis carbonaria]|nr:hypothetical protein EDC01DRAFT_716007 [Geopyxis carbonaria]
MSSVSSSPLRRAADAIPSKLKPPVAVLLNLGLWTLMGSLAAPWIRSDLDAVHKPFNTLSDYSGLFAMRTLEILTYWIGGWDAREAACLSTLSLAPTLHYLHTYQPGHAPLVPTLSVSTLIDIISVYLPLKFLRPSTTSTPRRKSTDSTRLFTALLASSVYQLCLHVASAKFLTTWLLSAGWDLESVARAHSAPEAILLTKALMMLPIGWAISDVVFFSDNDISEIPEPKDGEIAKGIWAMVARTWMRLSPRTRNIVKRTFVVAAYQVGGATSGASIIKGGNYQGAAGMSSVWASSTTIVGLVLAWVGNIQEE